MKIACVIVGTRGDVQPMVALATGLMKKGHEVTIFAPSENEELVRRYNCSQRRGGIPFHGGPVYESRSGNVQQMILIKNRSRDV